MYKISKISDEIKRTKRLKKIIDFILYILIIPIILFNFILIIKSFINPNKIPDFLGYKNFVIISRSMEPTIKKGDAIFIKETSQSDIKINDIISFKDNGEITTHRIIAIVEENGIKKYKTKGDNNNNEDKDLVLYENIEGKYQFKLEGFGNVIEMLKSKITLIVFIIIVCINYLYKARIKNKNQKRKEIRQKYNNERHKNI